MPVCVVQWDATVREQRLLNARWCIDAETERERRRLFTQSHRELPIPMNHRGAPTGVTRYQYGRRSRDMEEISLAGRQWLTTARGPSDRVGQGQRPVNKLLTISIFYYAWSCSRVYVRLGVRRSRSIQLLLMPAVVVVLQEDIAQARLWATTPKPTKCSIQSTRINKKCFHEHHY